MIYAELPEVTGFEFHLILCDRHEIAHLFKVFTCLIHILGTITHLKQK